MKVSVGRDSENSLKIVIVPLKSGLLATMVLVTLETALSAPSLGRHEPVPLFCCNSSIAIIEYRRSFNYQSYA